MSPEQAKSLKSIDHRTDLWSLGVVLHKCLSARTPFDGFSTLGQVIVAVCSEEPISVQEHAPWVRAELSVLLRQALKRDPNLRFQSAMQLLEALRPFLPGGPRITADMIVPLSEQEAGQIMPRRSEFPTQMTPPSQTTPMTGNGSSGAWLASASGPSATPAGGFAASGSALPALPSSTSPIRAGMPSSPSMSTKFVTTQDSDGSTPRKRRVWPLAVVAVVAMGGAAVFAVPKIRAMTFGSPSAAAAAPATAPSSTNAQPADTGAGSTPVVATMKAKVAVAPADATVEVDGRSVHVEAGFVTIEGSPGSVHKVKVAQEGRESMIDVVLTDKGPLPPKVAAAAGKPATHAPAAKATPAGAPPAKPVAAPAAKPTSPTPAKTAGAFDRSFE
jgi:serine/threonine-protein kinase